MHVDATDLYAAANKVVGQLLQYIPDAALEIDDVVQDLVQGLYESLQQGTLDLSTARNPSRYLEGAARLMLIDLFRRWSGPEGYHTISMRERLNVEDDYRTGYGLTQFQRDVNKNPPISRLRESVLYSAKLRLGRSTWVSLGRPTENRALARCWMVGGGTPKEVRHWVNREVMVVSSDKVLEATRAYRDELRQIREHGYASLSPTEKRKGVIFVGYDGDGSPIPIRPTFLASLREAMCTLGVKEKEATRVIRAGLHVIAEPDPDSRWKWVIYNFRRRGGKGIKWDCFPKGVLLTREGKSIFIEV